MALIAVLLLLTAATASVFWPLRQARRGRRLEHGDLAMELARDAKLGEIHDLELDYRLGKLSREDYEQLNATLRGEAVEILTELDSTPANGRTPKKGKPA